MLFLPTKNQIKQGKRLKPKQQQQQRQNICGALTGGNVMISQYTK